MKPSAAERLKEIEAMKALGSSGEWQTMPMDITWLIQRVRTLEAALDKITRASRMAYAPDYHGFVNLTARKALEGDE